MGAAGIIVEYNPLHSGHLRLLEAGRAALGPDTAMVCVMSGNFVQRGDFALLRKHARARAAVESGADLVLELPLPWAVSSAEGFAAGGVQALAATGVVEHRLFGSECGDVSALERVAAALLAPSFRDRLREALPGAVSFAAARQRALTGLLPEEDAALLESPNNILGIEYCKALLGQNAPLRAVVNGRVMGVSEDFYDPVLRRCLTEKPQKVANVLGQALVQLSGVGDWLLARRLRAMAEAGTVRVDEAGSTRGFYGAAACLA